MNQRFREQEKELQLEESLRRNQEEAERKNEEQILAERIARENSERLRSEYHEKKMRQQIRENNQELRELESRLRTAYVTKALAAQKKEIEVLRHAERLQEKQENDILEQARLAHLEQLRRDQENEREKKRKLGEDLKNQIISSHQQHQLLYEQFLREKAYLDEIARRVQDELMQEMKKKVKTIERTKKEMEAFKVAKGEHERIRQIELEEENERIKIYCQQRDKKIAQEEDRRRELEKQRENLNEKMVKELTELIVSSLLEILYFVCKCYLKSIHMTSIWQTLPKAFK